MDKRQVHYAWIITLAGILTSFSCLGLGRFALGMLLPSMGDALSLTYTQMGYISTSNFIGYLLAVAMTSGAIGLTLLLKRRGSM
jgi:fucose permease